ncbi:hypothetical protein [Myceligenerans indicum]|uniref:Uncharacterized protein n=1 Tax=Myceligenerans indicum TaxID=2593663 RepID=A0ABS1LJW6_9MICO|nr:hypothetical protein [Myceligenerans indicum]MBL0886423.1 hypothetical protein [Myceligenerans indicum]
MLSSPRTHDEEVAPMEIAGAALAHCGSPARYAESRPPTAALDRLAAGEELRQIIILDEGIPA